MKWAENAHVTEIYAKSLKFGDFAQNGPEDLNFRLVFKAFCAWAAKVRNFTKIGEIGGKSPNFMKFSDFW